MKVKKLKPKKKLLLTLTLKKFQTYKNFFFYKLELKLKQSLQVIFNYNLKKKKILFIGLPYCSNQLLFKSSKHIFVTKKEVHKFLNNKSILKNLSLIVFFNFKSKDLNLLNDLKIIKKPVIVIGQTFLINRKLEIEYTVNLNLNILDVKQFCSFLIYSTIKKIKI